MTTTTRRKPPKLRVVTCETRYTNSVRRELLDLLARTDRGEIVGIAYSILTVDRTIDAGSGGLLANDRMKAVGALFTAAQRVADGEVWP